MPPNIRTIPPPLSPDQPGSNTPKSCSQTTVPPQPFASQDVELTLGYTSLTYGKGNTNQADKELRGNARKQGRKKARKEGRKKGRTTKITGGANNPRQRGTTNRRCHLPRRPRAATKGRQQGGNGKAKLPRGSRQHNAGIITSYSRSDA